MIFRVLAYVASLCGMAWALAPPVSAYLDPGAGSALLQAIIGGIAVAAGLVAHRWRRLRQWLARPRKLSGPRAPER